NVGLKLLAVGQQAGQGFGFLIARQNVFREIENVRELVRLAAILRRAGLVLGTQQIIPAGMGEALADVFEDVAIGRADADGFSPQPQTRAILDPRELPWKKIL